MHQPAIEVNVQDFHCTHRPSPHLLEDGADSVVQPYDPASHWRWALPEEEVRRKHADERKVLLAAEAHDGQGCFHAQGEVLVLTALHAGDLLRVFVQIAQQLLLPLTASGDILLQVCGQLCSLEDAFCSREASNLGCWGQGITYYLSCAYCTCDVVCSCVV